ncbi:hypothetical protein [Streptacidiphilus sp. EB103A]|uniref:hypothetical protein n=1 Tax=Streptacidiphilus sp. EB103A TaxID=3156275 RepID=UPI00351572CE
MVVDLRKGDAADDRADTGASPVGPGPVPGQPPFAKGEDAWVPEPDELTRQNADTDDPDPVPRQRAFALPDLRPYLVVRGGHKAVHRGTVILVRKAMTLRAARKSAPTADGQGAEKPTTPAAKKAERVTADVVVATAAVGCIALVAAVRYIVDLLVVVLVILVPLVPVAYFVGLAAEERQRRLSDDGESTALEWDLGDTELEDPWDDDGDGDGTLPGGRRTKEERQIALFEWVHAMIGKRNGVHLRELLEDLHTRPGRQAVTMADLRERLVSSGIDVSRGVKVGGVNRPGVRRVDVPQDFTPLSDPGGHAVRLLPRQPPS